MTSYSIRQIGLPDRALLGAAAGVFAGSHSDAIDDSWVTSFVADSRTFAFVAVDDAAHVVGWVWGSTSFRPTGPRIGRIEQLDVAPDHRRRGIGTMLFDAAYGDVRRQGAGVIEAAVGSPLDRTVDAFLTQMAPVISDQIRVRWTT